LKISLDMFVRWFKDVKQSVTQITGRVFKVPRHPSVKMYVVG